jgi:osmotically-inducible protein OsmY
VAACHKGGSELTGTAGAASALEPFRAELIPDEAIGNAVRRHFQEEGLLRAEHVQVSVAQGIATLSGSVTNLLAKERVLSVTETIRGIRAVIDQVNVTPVMRSDTQIESDVATAFQHDLATRPYTIGVAVKDAKVTLSGNAESSQQKILFADVAKTVPGVKALENTLVIRYTAYRPESDIAADVKLRIADDVWLDGTVLAVTVTGHTVHVSGVVGSLAQSTRASSDAWVSGVDSVDHSGIRVDWIAQNDQRRVTDYPLKSDTEIAQAVRDAFRYDPRLKTFIPQVSVQSGTVVLSGTVDSIESRRAAEADATNTVGVWTVRDDVLVQQSGKPTDADIERGVKRVLSDDLRLSDGKSLHVSCANGKVALSGTIPSGYERFDALVDVLGVSGVAEVADDLTVKIPPADVKSSIEDRLYWDPMVERNLVSVEVAPDGVATLTGTVNTWGELKAASQDAMWGGATRVIDMLKLKGHPIVAFR